MSKKFLKQQAEELLNAELMHIKGGQDQQEVIDNCTTCSAACAIACYAACVKGKSHWQQ